MTEGWEKPVPLLDPVSTPFWRAAADGRLVIQRCPSCGQRQFYPRAVCRTCGADPEWETASGRGIIHTYTIIRQNYGRGFRDELPYAVAIIELEEGPRMMGTVTGVAVDDVTIGMPVEVHMVTVEEGVGVPMWRPAA